MRTAQRLFEGVNLDGETVGLITYMRTDSVQLSGEALAACRRQIAQVYGDRYLPEKPRAYKTRTKNAQEAHEAIRPTDVGRTPQAVGRFLDDDQRRLYELIWKRTLASQMASALLDRVTAEIASGDRQVGLRATGSTVAFDGFLKLYQEGRDDPAEDDENGGLLPPMTPGSRCAAAITPEQHFTEPPPRYTEASLVRRLEELGIGRPSTYAAIISVLQERNYVRLESRRFVPEERGRVVIAFLVGFFDQYVQPGFTADLESQLDEIAAGSRHWKQVLREFWGSVQRAGRRGQGTARRGGDRRAQRAARAASVPAARRRRRSARLSGMRRRPAQPQARPLRRVRGLLELSGLPLYQRLGESMAAAQEGARSRSACSAPIPTPARRSASSAALTAPTSNVARARAPSDRRCRRTWRPTSSIYRPR